MDFPKLKLIRTGKTYEIDRDDDVKVEKTNKDTTYPMVYVRAVDWAYYNDSVTMPHRFLPIEATLVGFLIEDEEDYISLGFEKFCQDDGNTTFRHVNSIPRPAIKELRHLGITPRKVNLWKVSP